MHPRPIPSRSFAKVDHAERNASRRAANLKALATATLRAVTGVTMGGATGAARPKTEPHRNRALLDMANGRPCLLWAVHEPLLGLPGVVACHSNLSIHGKAGARKADDEYSVWGCTACHEWLDRGPAPAPEKEAAFMAAHLRQVMEWRYMATAMHEPERLRKAARWALEQLGKVPEGDAR